MEADLLGVGYQPRHRQPALAIWHRGHRLAAERETGAVETVDGVRGGEGGRQNVKGFMFLGLSRFGLPIPVLRLDVLHHHRERTQDSVMRRD